MEQNNELICGKIVEKLQKAVEHRDSTENQCVDSTISRSEERLRTAMEKSGAPKRYLQTISSLNRSQEALAAKIRPNFGQGLFVFIGKQHDVGKTYLACAILR